MIRGLYETSDHRLVQDDREVFFCHQTEPLEAQSLPYHAFAERRTRALHEKTFLSVKRCHAIVRFATARPRVAGSDLCLPRHATQASPLNDPLLRSLAADVIPAGTAR